MFDLLAYLRRRKSVPPKAVNEGLPIHLKIGILGENIAAEHYIQNGFIIKRRNVTIHGYEIDFIAESKTHIVFAEVKTRVGQKDSLHERGRPATAVTPKKQAHLITAASYYAKRRRNARKRFRFDVVEVYLNADLSPALVYPIESAFSRDTHTRRKY